MAGTRPMVTIHRVCVFVSQRYRKHSAKGLLTPTWPRVEEPPQVAKVKVAEASQGVGDVPQAR